METEQSDYQPRHKSEREETRPSYARCTNPSDPWDFCPRHKPTVYADLGPNLAGAGFRGARHRLGDHR